jgi:hypothetical protein
MTTDATIELWGRLVRPFDPSGAVEVFTGLYPTAARQLVGAQLATSRQADQLLDRMHEIVRSLAVATTSSPSRAEGEVRGPVLWSETAAARASSPGASNVFICASPVKAYDTDENQVLVFALASIRDAARAADPTGHSHGHDEVIRRARYNGTRAIRALEHRTLASMRPRRPTARAVQKARTGLRARNYRSAVAVLERGGDPVDADVIVERSDEHMRRQHGLFLALADRLGEQKVRVDGASLRAGPLRYIPEHRAEAGTPYGILLGNLLLDVPDREERDEPLRAEQKLFERSFGRPVLIASGARDVERAVRLYQLGLSAAN